MFSASLLAFFIGFLSLSQEILWIRLFSFTNYSLPSAFAFVLAVYLIGIAVGAMIGNQLCRQKNLWKICGTVLLIASVFDLVGPWLYAFYSHMNYQVRLGGILILLTALFKAINFPIAHQLGVPATSNRVGYAVSKVYVANILGATLGPIIMSFILLNQFSTQQCFILCAMGTFVASLFCLQINKHSVMQMIGILIVFAIFTVFFNQDKEWMIKRVATILPLNLKSTIENKHGIITIYADGKNGDVIFGGNVYDGRTNLDPVINSNGINRLLILSALHDHPKKVLMIGLSIGTWLKLITCFPGVDSIDVVEINSGYIDAIKHYPKQASALLDPRMKLYVEDGRRFLRTHPDAYYDMIIMNTTYYWRAYTTNLLSLEFLNILKTHMNAHAILAYNMTGSFDAFKTGAQVFANAYLYQNFIIAADYDWRKKLINANAIKKLSQLKVDGNLLFPSNSDKLIQSFLTVKIITIEDIDKFYDKYFSAFGRQAEVITDDNLITEYKYGNRLG